MKHLSYILSCLLIGCSAIPETPQSVDIVVNDFGLYDQNGEFHTLYEHSDASAIVLFVQGNGCPIVRNAVHSLNAIRDEYAPKGVQFLMLNANLQDDRESVRVVSHAVFDNSAKNKLNPDPSATVHWGEQSFDEMLIGYMGIVDGKIEQTAQFSALNE